MNRLRIIKDENGVYKVQKLNRNTNTYVEEWIAIAAPFFSLEEAESFVVKNIEEKVVEYRSKKIEVVKEFVFTEDGTRMQKG